MKVVRRFSHSRAGLYRWRWVQASRPGVLGTDDPYPQSSLLTLRYSGPLQSACRTRRIPFTPKIIYRPSRHLRFSIATCAEKGLDAVFVAGQLTLSNRPYMSGAWLVFNEAADKSWRLIGLRTHLLPGGVGGARGARSAKGRWRHAAQADRQQANRNTSSAARLETAHPSAP